MMNRLRYPLLAVSLLILFAAIWVGMVRLGWRWPVLLPALSISHGPLMVSGFLGTLIGLERAVALGVRWAYLGPLATALGGFMLIFSLGGSLGALLITFGSFFLLLIFTFIVRRYLAAYTVTMALGALVWLIGNLLWLSGWPIYRVVLWWAGFFNPDHCRGALGVGSLALSFENGYECFYDHHRCLPSRFGYFFTAP